MTLYALVSKILICTSVALAAQPVLAQDKADTLPDAYSFTGSDMSFLNTPNRRHMIITGGEATNLGKLSVDLKKSADVLVQFSSGLTTVTPDDCPCSVRIALKVDDQAPIIIKRVNLGTVITKVKGKYQPDRQSADGNYVFSLPPGKHDVSLIVQRIEGESKILYAFYANMQALIFTRAKPSK